MESGYSAQYSASIISLDIFILDVLTLPVSVPNIDFFDQYTDCQMCLQTINIPPHSLRKLDH